MHYAREGERELGREREWKERRRTTKRERKRERESQIFEEILSGNTESSFPSFPSFRPLSSPLLLVSCLVHECQELVRIRVLRTHTCKKEFLSVSHVSQERRAKRREREGEGGREAGGKLKLTRRRRRRN